MPGSIDTDGTIRNSSGHMIGKIDSGQVFDDSYNSLGEIERDGTVTNATQMQIGKIEKDGTVRNRSFTTIGSVDDNGTVRDGSGMVIGRISSDVDKTWIATAFFFFDFDMS